MKLKLKVLRPVHIGSGKEITPSEYLAEKGFFTRLDMYNLFRDIQLIPKMEGIISSLQGRRYIGDVIDNSILNKYPLYKIPIMGKAKTANKINVKEYIKTAGRVFIPGSSIKGSILSALMNIFAENNDIKEFVKQNLGQSKLYDDLLKLLFNLITTDGENGKFARWIQVSDTNTLSPENCLQLVQLDVVGAKRGGLIPIFCETLKPGTIFEFDIKFQKIKNTITLDKLLKLIDMFYIQVYKKTKSDEMGKTKDTTLLRLGQGASAYSTSMLIAAEKLDILDKYTKYNSIHPPITKKLKDGHESLGWVEVIPQ